MSEQTPYNDALLDQFTQKGLIAKEIKVAEVIEVPNDSETWDAGEESMYGSYGIGCLLDKFGNWYVLVSIS